MVQAGAYIFQSKCSLNRYLEVYRERRDALSGEHGDNVQMVGDHRWMVHTILEISFKRLSRQSTTFLQLCAFLHHDGISERIFQKAACNIATYEPWFPATAQESDAISKVYDFLGMFRALDSPWDGRKFLRMIAEIRSHSLIDFDSANEMYSIHPLVHAWIRTTISNEEATRSTLAWILGQACEHCTEWGIQCLWDTQEKTRACLSCKHMKKDCQIIGAAPSWKQRVMEESGSGKGKGKRRKLEHESEDVRGGVEASDRATEAIERLTDALVGLSDQLAEVGREVCNLRQTVGDGLRAIEVRLGALGPEKKVEGAEGSEETMRVEGEAEGTAEASGRPH